MTRDEAKAKVLNAFFPSVFSSSTSCSDTQPPELVDRDMERTRGGRFFPLVNSPCLLHLSLLLQDTPNKKSFEYPWDGQTSMFLLLGLINVFQLLFNVRQLFKNAIQRSVQRQES